MCVCLGGQRGEGGTDIVCNEWGQGDKRDIGRGGHGPQGWRPGGRGMGFTQCSPNRQAVASHLRKHATLDQQGHEHVDSIVYILRAP